VKPPLKRPPGQQHSQAPRRAGAKGAIKSPELQALDRELGGLLTELVELEKFTGKAVRGPCFSCQRSLWRGCGWPLARAREQARCHAMRAQWPRPGPHACTLHAGATSASAAECCT
jgi:hypothetical protein